MHMYKDFGLKYTFQSKLWRVEYYTGLKFDPMNKNWPEKSDT